MKKSLLAVAAMTAFAGAAQAQSSVTVYGILDVGFINSNYTGTAAAANTSNVNDTAGTIKGNAAQKQVTNGFGQSAESTSRLGFKGSEDLGGGTSAVFTVEVALSPNTQAGTTDPKTANTGASGLAGGSFLFNRQTFAGLKKNGIGQATIGTQYTPIFDVQSATDAAGLNNLVGNAVYSGTLQSSGGIYNNGFGPYAGETSNQSLNAYSGAYTTRLSNALKFQSDRFSGFAGQLFYAQANQSQTQTGTFASATVSNGGPNNNTAWGLSGDYIWNKLQAVVAYQSLRSYNNTMALDPMKSTEAAGTAASFGNNINDAQTYAAVTYDFGILKAYYQFINRKATSTIDSTYQTKRTGNQIGVRSQLTPNISAYATLGLTNASYFGQNLASANGRTYQVGVDYYLSKRTNLYVAGGAANQSSNGYNVSGKSVADSAAAGGVGTSASNYAIGIRHTF